MEMIRCPNCQCFFKRNDLVVLDELNTVTHQACLDRKYAGFIKHAGPYHYIKKRYVFLADEQS